MLAKGALVGAGIGSVVGAVGAGAWALIDDKSFGSNEFWSYVLYGGLLGFGVGSLIGAILGGYIGANGWYSAKAIEFTNVGSNEVVLGRSPDMLISQKIMVQHILIQQMQYGMQLKL